MKSPEQQAEDEIALRKSDEPLFHAHSRFGLIHLFRKERKRAESAEAALQSKQAELDEAIEALRPVADWWNAYKATCDYYGNGIAKDTQPIVGNFPLLTYGHCRQAAAIVARHEAGKEAKP